MNYVQNNIDKHPRALVGVAINGFYTDDKVSFAKHCLHGIIADFKLDGCPRLIMRQAGDNKRKLECEDILNLFSFVDGSLATLPTFAAVNLLRLPTVSPNDVYSLAASVSTLAEKLEVVSRQIQKLESFSNRVEKLEAAQLSSDLPVRGNNFCESAMRVMKDKVQNSSKAFCSCLTLSCHIWTNTTDVEEAVAPATDADDQQFEVESQPMRQRRAPRRLNGFRLY